MSGFNLAITLNVCFPLILQIFMGKENILRASLVAQTVKNLPAMWKTSVQSLRWEDSLEKGIATHSSIFA